MEVKHCIKCGLDKQDTEFPKSRKKRDGSPRYAYCKPCHVSYQRVRNLKRNFNITPGDYDLMVTYQGGVCGICKRPPRTAKRLAVDHCHKTGLIRGVLCNWCNRILGLIGDDKEKAKAMVSYLSRPPGVKAIGRRHGIIGRTSNKASTRRRLNPGLLLERPARNG